MKQIWRQSSLKQAHTVVPVASRDSWGENRERGGQEYTVCFRWRRSDKSCWPWGSKRANLSVCVRTPTHTHICNLFYSGVISVLPCRVADILNTCIYVPGFADHMHTNAWVRFEISTRWGFPTISGYFSRCIAHCSSIVAILYWCEAISPHGIFCILEKRQQ